MKKSNNKKSNTVKKTTKRVNKVNKNIKEERIVKTDKKKEVKEEIKEEKISIKKGEKEKRYLIIGLLYLFCGLIWVIDGTSKLLVSESYMWDIIFGVILFLLSYFYFRKYNNRKK